MEKYGVHETEPKTSTDKTAVDATVCPGCGDALEKDTGVRKCRNCGTKPFEKEPDTGASS